MAETTGISWCHATFNPWIGCEKVSPGCSACYAEALADRYWPGTWGPDGERRRTSDANWRKPLRWQKLAEAGFMPDGRTPTGGGRPRVFCASLADVFEPRPELDGWRAELFDLIARTPALDWLVLTKRPEVARDWLAQHVTVSGLLAAAYGGRGDLAYLLPNLWLGVSIENARHTWRGDVLRQIPARVRFLSCEPLLGSLYDVPRVSVKVARRGGLSTAHSMIPADRAPLDLTGIDWVIVGGESGGRDARPMRPDWAREIRDACFDATVQTGNWCLDVQRPAFHFKQWGSYDASMTYRGAAPTAGGHLLDGVEWREIPTFGTAPVTGVA